MNYCNPMLCRLGQVENALKHIFSTGQQLDHMELQKLQTVERHVNRCADARKTCDWKSALREGDAAIAAGADSSSLVKLLNLHCLQFLGGIWLQGKGEKGGE